MATVARKRPDPNGRRDIRSLVAEVVSDPDAWLDAPNDQLGGEKPGDLAGTPREQVLLDLIEAIRIGMFT